MDEKALQGSEEGSEEESKVRNFIIGVMLTSFFWLIALTLVCHRADQGYREVEHQAFKENYSLKQRNNLLEKENTHLSKLYDKLRKRG